MKIGVLALQGGFAAHARALRALGAQAAPLRRAAEVEGLDGLVLPGGESTVLRRVADDALVDALREAAARGVPLLATCAGAIWAADGLDLLDAALERNAYGRQLASFEAPVYAPALGPEPFPGVFIRAPAFGRMGSGVEVLGRLGGEAHHAPVLVRQGPVTAATFHPELAGDLRVHRLWLEGRRREAA